MKRRWRVDDKVMVVRCSCGICEDGTPCEWAQIFMHRVGVITHIHRKEQCLIVRIDCGDKTVAGYDECLKLIEEETHEEKPIQKR